jgi:hypothetical protein
MDILLASQAAAIAVGIALLAWSWRGRRIDNHPLCRRCGYDLIGLPTDTYRCSECGADVRGARAIRFGHRCKRMTGIGLGLTLMIVGGGSFAAWRTLHGLTPQQKPVWWLMIDARSRSPAVMEAAMNELIARCEGGKLSGSQQDALMDRLLAAPAAFPPAMDELILRAEAGRLSAQQTDALLDRILSAQADVNGLWRDAWALTFEKAGAAGKLDDARWQRYWQQACRISFVVRPRVRRGDPIAMGLGPLNRPKATFGTSLSAFPQSVQLRLVELLIDGVECQPPKLETVWNDTSPVSYLLWQEFGSAIVTPPPVRCGKVAIDLPAEVLAKLRDGPQRVNGVVEILVTTQATVSGAPSTQMAVSGNGSTTRLSVSPTSPDARSSSVGYRASSPKYAIPPGPYQQQVAITHVNVEGWFDLLPTNVPSVGQHSFSDEQDRIHGMFHVDQVQLADVGSEANAKTADFELRIKPIYLPLATVAADVFLRSGSRQWLAGSICIPWGDFAPTRRYQARVDGFAGDVVDVVLVPNTRPAAQTLNITEIWADEIILKDVPVHFTGKDNQ